MKEPVYLASEMVLTAHGEVLSRFGGEEEACDEMLLDTVLNPPPGKPLSLFALAAAYAHGIVKNHPFVDGNKRSGFMAAALFLEVNGQRFGAPEEEVVAFTRGLAAGEIGAEEYAQWLGDSCK